MEVGEIETKEHFIFWFELVETEVFGRKIQINESSSVRIALAKRDAVFTKFETTSLEIVCKKLSEYFKLICLTGFGFEHRHFRLDERL